MSTEAKLIARLEDEGPEAVRLKIQAGLIERSELESAVKWLIDKDAAAARGTPRPIFRQIDPKDERDFLAVMAIVAVVAAIVGAIVSALT